MTLHHIHTIEFKNTINVNVSIKEDELVVKLQQELADALAGKVVGPEVQAAIDKVFAAIKSNTAKVQSAVEDNQQ